MDNKLFIRKVLTASPKELSEVLQQHHEETLKESGGDVIAVKAKYKLLIQDIDSKRKECQIYINFGNYTPFEWDEEEHKEYRYDVYQGIANLDTAREFLDNNPVIDKPNTTQEIKVDIDKIDWSKPVFTAEEVRTMLNVSPNTFRKWIDDGWMAHTRMDGSNKVLISREDLEDFLKNNKIYYPRSK